MSSSDAQKSASPPSLPHSESNEGAPLAEQWLTYSPLPIFPTRNGKEENVFPVAETTSSEVLPESAEGDFLNPLKAANPGFAEGTAVQERHSLSVSDSSFILKVFECPDQMGCLHPESPLKDEKMSSDKNNENKSGPTGSSDVPDLTSVSTLSETHSSSSPHAAVAVGHGTVQNGLTQSLPSSANSDAHASHAVLQESKPKAKDPPSKPSLANQDSKAKAKDPPSRPSFENQAGPQALNLLPNFEINAIAANTPKKDFSRQRSTFGEYLLVTHADAILNSRGAATEGTTVFRRDVKGTEQHRRVDEADYSKEATRIRKDYSNEVKQKHKSIYDSSDQVEPTLIVEEKDSEEWKYHPDGQRYFWLQTRRFYRKASDAAIAKAWSNKPYKPKSPKKPLANVIHDLETRLADLRNEHRDNPTFGPRADVVQELFDLFKSNSFSAEGVKLPIGRARESYSITLAENTFKELLKKPKEDDSKKRSSDAVTGTGGSKPGGRNAKRHKRNDRPNCDQPSDSPDRGDGSGGSEQGSEPTKGSGSASLQKKLLSSFEDESELEIQSATGCEESDSESHAATDWDVSSSEGEEDGNEQNGCASISSLSDQSYATAMEEESATLSSTVKRSCAEDMERQGHQLTESPSFFALGNKRLPRIALGPHYNGCAAIYDSDQEDIEPGCTEDGNKRNATLPNDFKQDIRALDSPGSGRQPSFPNNGTFECVSREGLIASEFPLSDSTLDRPSFLEPVPSYVQHVHHRRQVTNIQEEGKNDIETYASYRTAMLYCASSGSESD